jgi:hypothetical protein
VTSLSISKVDPALLVKVTEVGFNCNCEPPVVDNERDEVLPLYNRFKKYFSYLNTGFKGKRYDVFAYNGGLFKPDELLDAIKIDDELLYIHTHKLSEYDFESEVDVNILGHIFENSLNELDEIQAQLQGEEIEKAKTKRKKDYIKELSGKKVKITDA